LNETDEKFEIERQNFGDHEFERFSPQNETLRFELAFLHAQGHLRPTMNDLHYREGLMGAGSTTTQIRLLTSPG
jgi:hypothetical protein